MTTLVRDAAHMSFDSMVPSLPQCADAVARQESLGQCASWTTETAFDPFVQLGQAAARTSRIKLGTAVAVAFARNPMSLAVSANHLQLISQGRLLLGIGTQVRAHIQRRYSMPWGQPAARMREYVQALRAIWSCWNDREPLSFRGQFYEHTLMAPLFDPGPNPFGPPPVYVAGVGDRMIAVAGEVADGFLAPPLASAAYLRERHLPALASGWRQAHDGPVGTEICAIPFIVTGRDQPELDAALEAARERIAFYASTPAYASILDLHGWSSVRQKLTEHSRRQEWQSMAALVTDSMVETFAVIAPPADLLAAVRARYAGLADRVILYPAGELGDAVHEQIFAALRASGGPPSSRASGGPRSPRASGGQR
jgi:probable F420-dependent oxidoreductase